MLSPVPLLPPYNYCYKSLELKPSFPICRTYNIYVKWNVNVSKYMKEGKKKLSAVINKFHFIK